MGQILTQLRKPVTSHEKKLKSPRKPIKGICGDAVQLHVTREHLTRVLRGERSSVSLVKKYEALKSLRAFIAPNAQPEKRNKETVP